MNPSLTPSFHERREAPRNRSAPAPRGLVGRNVAIVAMLLLTGAGMAAAGATGIVDGVGFEQKIGSQLPMDVRLTGTDGIERPLGDFFHDKPVVLTFAYARCPQLCSVVADATVAALREIKATAGRDFDVISITMDPAETVSEAVDRMDTAVRRYGRTGALEGWEALTGNEGAIRRVATASGFHYAYDPASRQYAHPSGFIVLTPAGKVSRYFIGIDYAPSEVAAALRRAGEGATGEPVYNLLLRCFRGGGIAGRYGPLIWRILEVAVSLTVAALVGGVGWMLWEEKRAAPRNETEAAG